MTLPFDPTRRREDQDDLERLLAAALPAALAPDVPGHVDAERLAAWVDQGLDPAEQLQVDVHLAACESCQELAAAFVRASPEKEAMADTMAVAPARVLAWTPARVSKWAGPLAAAAAAVTLWMVTPADPVEQAADMSRVARADATPPPPAIADPEAESTELQRRLGRPDPARPADSERKSSERAAPIAPPAATAGAPVPAPAAGRAIPPDPLAVAASPPPPPPPPPAAPPATASTALADRTRVLAEATPPIAFPTFEVVTPPGSEAGAGGGGAGRGGAAGGSARGLAQGQRRNAASATPPAARWRVVAGRRIERSLDAGLTWSPLDFDPPEALVAGGSPAASICWLIGEHGLVLISTDGARFARAAVPADVTLTAIVTTTARDATVTAIDGRRFVTADGGQTWRPLQDFPTRPF